MDSWRNEKPETQLFTFPKLNSFNYRSWQVDMKVLLIDRGCWEYVSGETSPLPEGASEKEKQDFKRKKERAFTTIYQGVERQFLTLISHTTDGKEAWKILKSNFEPTSRARLASLVDEFYDLKFIAEEETIGIFCKRVEEKHQLIKEAGFDMPECLVCFQLIRKLPADYDNLVQLLYRLEDKQFNFSYIESQLISESGRITQKRKDEGLDLVSNAYLTKSKVQFPGRLKPPNQQSSGSVLDHHIDRNSGEARICRYCKRKGHIFKNCFKRKSDEKKPDVKAKTWNKSNREENKYFSNSQGGFYTEDMNGHSYVTTTKEIPTCELDEWLVDTAATSHFCNQKEWFENFEPLPPTEALIGDKNCTSDIRGVGNVIFYAKDKNRFLKITLSNVLYAPNMRRNLISGARIDIAGYKILWYDNQMILYNMDEYFITIPRVDKFYILYGMPARKFESYNVSDNDSAINTELWHRRFGHVNFDLLNKMRKHNSVTGIEKIKGTLNSCITCNLSKSTRTSFKPQSVVSRLTNNVLDRVHMDVWGKAPVKSLAGKSYFLSMIDDFSRYSVVYIIEKKSDVFMCFKDYLVSVERQLNRKIKCVRTDNGLEFCSNEFENYLKSHGIKMERASAFTPEQSGVAERFNRIAIEGVRAMLQESGLQHRFWAEALHTFVHIRNRCEHKLTNKATPYEIWTGKKPSVKYFRAFGSLAYTHIPHVKRNKLQSNADIGILVGYASKTKGYRVWLPKSRRVVETIHVKIDESRNGVLTLFGQKSRESSHILGFNDFLENEPTKGSDELESKNGEKLVEEVKNVEKPKLEPIDITKWSRVERPRTKSSRIDVYYYPPVGKPRLRSLNQTEKYCKKENLDFKADLFNFKPTNKMDQEIKCVSDCSSNNSSDENAEESEYVNANMFQEEIYNTEIPKNFDESQKLPERDNWRRAMDEELNTMKERKVWKLVNPPENSRVIGCKWVYSIKKEANGKIKKFKARLVAQGFKQRFGLDYTNIFSPVINFSIIKLMFIVLVSWLGWVHVQLDVKAAYLYGELQEKIYMYQPHGYVESGNENKVCLLQKSIYGLHQSGRVWNNELNFVLKKLGFVNLKHCNCVYKFKNDIVLLVYVDDIVLFGRNNDCIECIVSLLKSELDITELGNIRYLLGVNFESENGNVYLHQKTYIEKLKSMFTDLPKSFVNLPFKVGNLPPKANDEIKENEIMQKYPYRSLIGCLSFLADRSRPDIAFSVNIMSQFCNSYTYQHWLIVVDLLNYVFNTSGYKLNLSNVSDCHLVAYSDASWGSQLTQRHSSSGYIICVGKTPFTWKSNKQKCIALSSMEAEFVSLTDCVKELLWYKNVLTELELVKLSMPILYCDNKSAMFFCENSVENAKTKHIDIRLHFIRKLLKDKLFYLKYVSSRDNLADFLTKAQTKDNLKYFIQKVFAFPWGRMLDSENANDSARNAVTSAGHSCPERKVGRRAIYKGGN